MDAQTTALTEDQKNTLSAFLVLATCLEIGLEETGLNLMLPTERGPMDVRKACRRLRHRWIEQGITQALGLDD